MSTPTLEHLLSFTQKDFTIESNKNETRLISFALIPEEVVGQISDGDLVFEFNYRIPEKAQREKAHRLKAAGHISVEVGRYTGKLVMVVIHDVKLDTLSRQYDQMLLVLDELKRRLEREVVQKNYELAIYAFRNFKAEIVGEVLGFLSQQPHREG